MPFCFVRKKIVEGVQILILSSSSIEMKEDRESISLLQALLIYLGCLPPRTTQASAVADRESKVFAPRQGSDPGGGR